MDLNDKKLKLSPKRLEALHLLGLNTAEDLLSYYPFRYEIMDCRPFDTWQIKEKVVFEGEVVSPVRSWRHGRMTNSTFEVSAWDRILKITIFNRPWARNLELNQIITVQGIYMGGNRVTAISYDTKPLADHDEVTPVYSTKAGIRQTTIHESIRKVYEYMQNEIIDEIPEEFLRRYRLLRKSDALYRIHFPQSQNDVKQAVRTLKYEEFLRFFTAVQMVRSEEREGITKLPKIFDRKQVDDVINGLPYSLTEDQRKALEEIEDDMSSTRPMYRLVQGDVGCGKTAVAALAMYAAVLSGCQAALLAPTEILARQHLQSLQSILKGTDVRIEVLYAGLSAPEKRAILEAAADGSADIVIGTHSLIQESVQFKNLGLVVADEQQRFGVEQRRALREKGNQTDFLLMSATPIPRTLASTLFGDMDISTIETMPAGRKDPVTLYIRENSFRSVLKDVTALLEAGRQLYIICAAVDQNDDYDARNVGDTASAIQKLYPQYQTGILHGRMSSDEKQSVMKRFSDGEIRILVSTTVVEVGMNVVNATGMIIYDADRFGLSQLHQLRGRIQRGSERGYCWLLSGSH
ncbi:MAG TPA: ATP-dependent DNA helicase RecG, partial [Erysipelotrichaceae bacterium]|nr:ATP-dependent DNA helicase RecG [Erysipelotrichaceae bacterium]